ncbi:MAG: hypothetical protein HYZ65_16280, partial [Burkholderiales bacterium]|nr:hypothetical protein [Burkholderiales bacterium]
LNEQLALRTQPVLAADFLREAHPAGPMFNEYGWGGYLSWTLYPDYPIYVDGRTDLYDEAFLLDYMQLASGAEQWALITSMFWAGIVIFASGCIATQCTGLP